MVPGIECTYAKMSVIGEIAMASMGLKLDVADVTFAMDAGYPPLNVTVNRRQIAAFHNSCKSIRNGHIPKYCMERYYPLFFTDSTITSKFGRLFAYIQIRREFF